MILSIDTEQEFYNFQQLLMKTPSILVLSEYLLNLLNSAYKRPALLWNAVKSVWPSTTQD